jgi:hypothetical protein
MKAKFLECVENNNFLNKSPKWNRVGDVQTVKEFRELRVLRRAVLGKLCRDLC